MQNLPSHRQFLTSLITRLVSSSPEPPQDEQDHLFPPSSQPLLLTLHVLFPSLLLPALDLLDRRLIQQIVLAPGDKQEEEREQLQTKTYIVKSLATTISRRHRDSSSTTSKKSYVVSLVAWNCSCASFAFDAFPANVEEHGSSDSAKGHPDWEFGTMSLDGLGGMGADVPCCKHLLACLLAEQWGEQLGCYVDTREVSEEEYAGTVAGL